MNSIFLVSSLMIPVLGLCVVILAVCIGVGVARHKKKRVVPPPANTRIATPQRPAEPNRERPTPQPGGSSRQELLVRLSQAQQQLEQIAACKPYIKLFGGMALPLQILLGLAKAEKEVDAAFLQDFFYERVVRELQFACKKAGFRLVSARELIPPSAAPSPYEDASSFPDNELPYMIKRYESECKGGKIDIIQRDLVLDLRPLMWELSQLQEDSPLDRDQLVRLAKEATALLEQHQIYPMYHDDPRLLNKPELLGRFAPSSAIPYPGLFWKDEGNFVVLGSYIGTRKAGE